MNKLLHNNTLFTLTLLGIATALAFLFFSFVSENTANIALLYIIAQILIARYTNGYLHGLFSSVFSVICINFFFTYPFFRLNFTLSGYPVTFIGMLIITLLTTATTSRLKKQTEILAKQEKQVQIARQESLRANLLRAVSHDLRTPPALLEPLPLFCLMVPSYQMQKKENFLKILKMTPAGSSIWLKIFSV